VFSYHHHGLGQSVRGRRRCQGDAAEQLHRRLPGRLVRRVARPRPAPHAHRRRRQRGHALGGGSELAMLCDILLGVTPGIGVLSVSPAPSATPRRWNCA
jgi:hypothetical protein